MSELRRDPVTGRWVIIYTDKQKVPTEYEVESHDRKEGTCPFCIGNEAMTPPEVDAFRDPGTKPNTSGWLTRIVPNKFPALMIEGGIDRTGIGLYDVMNGVGAHEVVIESPDHKRDLTDLMDHEIERVIWAYRNRFIDLRGDKRFKYILIFKNYGFSAGASLQHPHTQLIALPIIPKRVNEELVGAAHYFEYRERCVFCDMIREELQDEERLVCENKNFVSFAPFASCFPFETWILPRQHESDFSIISREQIIDLARILRESLRRIKVALRDPSYNFVIHTCPVDGRTCEEYHWRVEIMPKLAKVAGFEWGSGFYINTTSPELAAKCLREAKI